MKNVTISSNQCASNQQTVPRVLTKHDNPPLSFTL